MSYYKRVDDKGNTTTVEGYSHNSEIIGAIPINKIEYDSFIVSLPIGKTVIVRNLATELDSLKVRVSKLEL